MTPRILIRCDASLSIGSGHVIRCRTLARKLRDGGADVLFLCRRQPGDLIALLEREFRVLILPEHSLVDCSGFVGRDLYSAWLGCTQIQDADDCLRTLDIHGVSDADWIVVDHYGIDAVWQSHVLNYSTGIVSARILAIDDLADRIHSADLLLDQNFFGADTDHRYEGLVSAHCCQLLGPSYALLGPEYSQLNQLVPSRNELRRVLVFFGGVDSENVTGRTLEALMHPALLHLAVDVVLGQQSPHRERIADLVAHRPHTTLHNPLPSLAGLISRADLAIGAGGATTWERACLKLPSLVVAIAANQLPFAEALHHAGHHEFLGYSSNVTMEQIRLALLSRIANPGPYAAGDDLTDGFGTSRVVLAMLGDLQAINLRLAKADDESAMFHITGDFTLNQTSSSSKLIGPFDQRKWFLEGLADPNRLIFLAVTADGCPIGQICFERQSSFEKDCPAVATISFFFDRCISGLRLPSILVELGLKKVEQHWGPAFVDVGGMNVINSSGNVHFHPPGFVKESLPSAVAPFSSIEAMALPISRITLLSDRGSWLNPYLPDLIYSLWQRGHAVRWIHSPADLVAGDVCLLLSCSRLLKDEQLEMHKHNLVVHESALPHGQGWSPMTWQILEGISCIPVTLMEAITDLDSGPIYLQDQIDLQGHELVDEWRDLQAQKTLELCLFWIDRYQEVVSAAQPQHGDSSYFPRRKPVDSQLNPNRSLVDQFNLLRVVDNHAYPAFFYWRGRKYKLQIQSIYDS